MKPIRASVTALVCLLACLLSPLVNADSKLIETIKQIKPGIVGVGIYQPTGKPQSRLYGTGFVIGNGRYVVTNYHVLQRLDAETKQQQVVFSGTGPKAKVHQATLLAFSEVDDLAVLKLQSGKLAPIPLADKQTLAEGSDIAFTGFPIGAVLGLYPVTHKGMIASITPDVIPLPGSKQLTPAMIKKLKNPKLVYQLDATAYPGNSGSPVYLPESGKVVAIINKVLVRNGKESVISAPSGITYAIPVKYLFALLTANNIDVFAAS
ncbi:serine protease [Thalassotalea sp. Y01]|uniref:S1 family peptidase n=1 Tax=Thalassotalea sp. Y01 TaxID=2729613 RepID=UPI00145D01CF|nr:serine protease [Thalassotalea sp. Y01]NMP16178.1 trypsin-like peptidase domain-containing protein [Thalassotalea sp. Y01]